MFDHATNAVLATFGQAVTHHPEGNASREVTGVFREEREMIDLDGGHAGQIATVLTLRLRHSEEYPVGLGDLVTVGGKTYRVTDVETHRGMARCVLGDQA